MVTVPVWLAAWIAVRARAPTVTAHLQAQPDHRSVSLTTHQPRCTPTSSTRPRRSEAKPHWVAGVFRGRACSLVDPGLGRITSMWFLVSGAADDGRCNPQARGSVAWHGSGVPGPGWGA